MPARAKSLVDREREAKEREAKARKAAAREALDARLWARVEAKTMTMEDYTRRLQAPDNEDYDSGRDAGESEPGSGKTSSAVENYDSDVVVIPMDDGKTVTLHGKKRGTDSPGKGNKRQRQETGENSGLRAVLGKVRVLL